MSSIYPKPLNDLIEILKFLPGVGKRSAERLALSILNWNSNKIKSFAQTLLDIVEQVGHCPNCGNYSMKNELCSICSDPRRDAKVICVVEEASEIKVIESSGVYKGIYLVLGGKLSPLSGKGVDELNLKILEKHLEDNLVSEIIIALSPDVEGQATSIFLSDMAKEYNVKVTQIAQGIPAGGDLSYVNSATISAALSGRKVL